MELLRVATVALTRPVPAEFGRWPYTASNGITVTVSAVNGKYMDITDAQSPPLPGSAKVEFPWDDERLDVAVGAQLPCGPPEIEGGRLVVPTEPRRAAELAIGEYADLLAVTHQCRRFLRSPFACVALAPTGAHETSALRGVEGLHRSESDARSHPRLVPHRVPTALQGSLTDRMDGLDLLADALTEETPVGRVRALFLLLERAFATGPGRTIKPLTAFLASAPRDDVLKYRETEVARWMTHLRPLSMHADRRPEYARSPDVAPYLPRVEQAAYDVLFNKEVWRNKSSARRSAVGFATGLPPSGPVAVFQHGASLMMEWMDPFNVFPLDRRASVTFREGWIWRFPGQEPGEQTSST